MIKIYAVEMLSGVNRYYEIEPDIKDRTTEGYFCTVEELRELWLESRECCTSGSCEFWKKDDFDQWLASKDLK